MKKIMMMIMTAVIAAGVANAVDFGATADFASAYVWRGATVNDGLVFQPGASISGLPIPAEYGALTFATWRSRVRSPFAPQFISLVFNAMEIFCFLVRL